MPNMKRKTGRKLIRTANAKKAWTAEDDEYLKEYWGRRSIKFIAHKLGRSKNALICRVRRMGLGAYLDNGDDPTLNQVYSTIHARANGGYGAYRLNNWIEAGLPYKEKRVDNCKFRVINIDDFWEWAEQHKDLMDFSLFERYSLGAEPAWVDVKRKADHNNRVKTQPHNKQWSPSDDLTLKRMIARGGCTWTQVASEVHRSEGACRRRAMDLGIETHGKIKRNPIRKWTDEEIRIMLEMLEAGYSYRQIGEKLGRGDRAVESKFARLLNPEYFTRTERLKGRNRGVKYSGTKGVNPKDVLYAYENGAHTVAFQKAEAYGTEKKNDPLESVGEELHEVMDTGGDGISGGYVGNAPHQDHIKETWQVVRVD
jgi:hypothetical protein